MPKMEFFFDFTSPYTFIASERLLNEPRYKGVEIDWCPFLLGGLFKSTGNRSPIEVAPKGAYMYKDLMRLSSYFGVKFQFPMAAFPMTSLLPTRGAIALKRQGSPKFLAYTQAIFRAFWQDNRDIADVAVWSDIVKGLGLDPEQLKAAAEAPENKEALKKATERAADLGAFGAPTFIVNGELLWGVDRMFLVDRELGLPAAT